MKKEITSKAKAEAPRMQLFLIRTGVRAGRRMMRMPLRRA